MDIAELGISVDTSSVRRGGQQLDGFAETGERTERRVTKSGQNMSRSFRQTADAARDMQSSLGGNNTRMMALQLSQVAQQASATGNVVQALAIQLPDLALGFGPIGIGAGVVAGALLPMAANMAGAGAEAESFGDTLDDLSATIDSYRGASALATSSTRDLIDEFGLASPALRRALQDLAAIEKIKAYQSIANLTASVRDMTTSFMSGSAVSAEIVSDLFNLEGGIRDNREAVRGLVDDLHRLTTAETLDAQLDAARNLRDALREAAGAPEDMTLEQQNFARALSQSIIEMESLRGATEEADVAALNFATTMGTADASGILGQTQAIAAAMGIAADEALRYNAALNADAGIKNPEQSDGLSFGLGSVGDPSVGDASLTFGNMEDRNGRRQAIDPRTPQEILDDRNRYKPKSSRSGGSGGGSKKSDTQREGEREAERVRRDIERATLDAMSATERYKAEVADLQELHDGGYLSASEYAQGVDLLDQELRETQTENLRRGIESISDSMADAIVKGDSLGDVLSSTFQQIASSWLSNGLNTIFSEMMGLGGGGSGGGGGGGLFSSILSGLGGGVGQPLDAAGVGSWEGGGYTWDGPRSGGLDGKGGRLGILHPRETVIDHTKGQGAQTVYVEVINGDLGFNDRGEFVRQSRIVARQENQKALSQYDRGLQKQMSHGSKSKYGKGRR
ncbi:hypothetical protein [Tranquillimonas rosea]|uniref:hypothetical protein n=1 Tax=Tranquillimonas rosea TaxID=641238 RepID=UPI003BAABB3C